MKLTQMAWTVAFVVSSLALPVEAHAESNEPRITARVEPSGRAGRRLRHGLYLDTVLQSGFQPRGQPALCVPGSDGQCVEFGKLPGFGATLRLGYQIGWIGIELVGSGMADLHYGSLPPPPRPEGIPGQLGAAVDALTTRRFLVYNFGVFAGMGPRLTTPGRNVALTLGVTPGMSFRWFNVASMTATDSESVGESQQCFSLHLDAALLVGGRGAKLSMGVLVWLDFLATEPTLPATGSAGRYTVGRTPSLFVGPSLGVHWGGA